MNTSATFQSLFNAIETGTLPGGAVTITVGDAGKGTFFDPASRQIRIDPGDFSMSDSKLLVARIGHEIAHAVDFLNVSSIPGADGLTPSPSVATNLSPADYNLKRASDEGFALVQEFFVARELGLTKFSADYAGTELFARLTATYLALKSSDQPPSVISGALVAMAGSEGRSATPSTADGLNGGMKYGQIDIKDYVLALFQFKDPGRPPKFPHPWPPQTPPPELIGRGS